MDELQTQLESILFVANKPAPVSMLAKLVEKDEPAVLAALQQLQIARKDSGIIVMEANGQWQLGTNPQNVNLVKSYLTADLREKLTDATVEVLGIIAYRQPISKTEIEAIRGVNCQYSIRQLLMRGLIEKAVNPNDSRSTYYQLTTEFLQHMGLQSVSDLPEFEKLTASIKLPETPEAKVEKVEPEQPTVTTSYTDPVANFPTTPQNVATPVPPPVFSEPEAAAPEAPKPAPVETAGYTPHFTAPTAPATPSWSAPTPTAPVTETTPSATPTEDEEFIDDDEDDEA